MEKVCFFKTLDIYFYFIKSDLNAHNRKVRRTEIRENINCLVMKPLYEGTVASKLSTHKAKIYTGVCEPIFKSRYGNHKTPFNLRIYENSREIAKEVWEIKEENQ